MWQKIKNIYHLLNAVLANIWYGFPSRNLVVIGVTGTDGKTTTVNLIHHILTEAGLNSSMISTVGASIEGFYEDIGLHVTTPSEWTVQKLLKRISKLKDKRKKYVVLEVTSHALDQHRVWGVNFEVGVLTNVTDEHLDYHKTYENYLKTKSKLMKKSKVAIINKDDKSFEFMNEKLRDKNTLVYSFLDETDLNTKGLKVQNNVLEKFNLYNVLAAALACKTLGLDIKTIEKALPSFLLPKGRQEIVSEGPFRVMIDFAHTPNSFEKILSSINLEGDGRLIHVFGCAGKRDAVKRPVMGGISAKYSNAIILTAEDPRREKVEDIIEDIALGIDAKDGKPEVYKISDRSEAIQTAVTMAKDGDFVLITGKGHERSMNISGTEVEWSDEESVKEALALRS
ncbi:MAG: UDP-N-acetylmuramoyl-L-alanyl-D-glutamate--2,6-diaminopimelate ligase [Candidatus Levyibacteriota bacterium]